MEGRPSVAAITSERNVGFFQEVLDEGSQVAFEPSKNPDVKGLLKEWSRQGVDVCVVDEDGLGYPEVSELDILAWPVAHQEHPLRVVLIASPDREDADPFFTELVSVGIYDILIPGEHEDLGQAVKERIASPARLADAIRWHAGDAGRYADEAKKARARAERARKKGGVADAGDAGQLAVTYVPKPVYEKTPAAAGRQAELRERIGIARPGTEPQMRYEVVKIPSEEKMLEQELKEGMAATATPAAQKADPAKPAEGPRRSKTIAVASFMPKSGVTHLSMSLAFWIAKNKPKSEVTLVMTNNAEYARISAGFKARTANGFCYKGVRICPAATREDVRDADYTIYDCSCLKDSIGTQAQRIFSTADKKVVCVSGQIWEYPAVKEGLRRISRTEAMAWTWCTWATSSDMVRALKASLLGKEVESLASGWAWFKLPPNTEMFAEGTDGLSLMDYNFITQDVCGQIVTRAQRKAARREAEAAKEN